MNIITTLQKSLAARICKPGMGDIGSMCGIAVCGNTCGPLNMAPEETYVSFEDQDGLVYTATVDDVMKAEQVSENTWRFPNGMLVTLYQAEHVDSILNANNTY